MSVSIELLAVFLLLAHLASAYFIATVIVRQWGLLREPIADPRLALIRIALRRFRVVLFVLSCVILLGNLIPIIIDVLTIFAHIPRNSPIQPISIAYAVSNAITSVVSAYLIFQLYRIARNEKTITEFTGKQLAEETAYRKAN